MALGLRGGSTMVLRAAMVVLVLGGIATFRSGSLLTPTDISSSSTAASPTQRFPRRPAAVRGKATASSLPPPQRIVSPVAADSSGGALVSVAAAIGSADNNGGNVDVSGDDKEEEEEAHSASRRFGPPTCLALQPIPDAASWFERVEVCDEVLIASSSAIAGRANAAMCATRTTVKLIVKGTVCAAQRTLSLNASLSAEIRSRFGPLYPRLRLEGPRFATVVPWTFVRESDAVCAYRFDIDYTGSSPTTHPVRLEAGAQSRIGLELLYDDYFVFDETRGEWPNLRKQPILSAPAKGFTTNYHMQQCTLPSEWVWTCLGSSGKDSVAPEASVKRIPNYHEPLNAAAGAVIVSNKKLNSNRKPVACERKTSDTAPGPSWASAARSNAGGTWVARENHDDGVETGRRIYTRVRVKKIQREPIIFQWALQSDKDWRWAPHNGRSACGAKLLPLPSSEDVLAAALDRLGGKRILIGGDSQLRALYFGMVNVLSGLELPCVRNISTAAAEPPQCIANVKGSHRKKVGTSGVQVDFVDDLFLDRVGSSRYDGYDVVIVGFAQHPASKEHWSFDRFRSAVNAKMPKLRRLKDKGTSVVWYAAPQYPHTRVGFPVAVRDWRTDGRLVLFNEYAIDAAAAVGIPSVDAFAISTGMSHTSPDQAHFSNFVSAELVRVTLHTILQSPAFK